MAAATSSSIACGVPSAATICTSADGHGRAGAGRGGADVGEQADAAEQRQRAGDADDVGGAVVATEVEGQRRLLVGDEHGHASTRPSSSLERERRRREQRHLEAVRDG